MTREELVEAEMSRLLRLGIPHEKLIREAMERIASHINTAETCEARHPVTGKQCGMPKGHSSTTHQNGNLQPAWDSE